MPKTKVVAASDQFGALVAMQEALAGNCTLFITPNPTDDLLPESYGLADEYENVALVVETSGSTAAPKRVALSAEALRSSARATAGALGGSGTWLLALPTNYIAGAMVLVRSVLADSAPVMLNSSVPFTAEGFARMAGLLPAANRFTSLVPAQLVRLAQSVDTDAYLLEQLQSFEAVLVGGQAADPQLVREFRTRGIRLVQTYGSSETAGGCVYDGKPLDGVSLRVRNELIEIAGPMLANGYLSGGSADAFFDDQATRWFRTSDLGLLDQGRLTVIGRADRVFISGGVKVSLDELEATVVGLAGVVETAAVALKDPIWGERAAVLYVGSPEVADDLAAVVLANLGPAANPVRVIRVDELPKLKSGKPDYLGIVAFFESA